MSMWWQCFTFIFATSLWGVTTGWVGLGWTRCCWWRQSSVARDVFYPPLRQGPSSSPIPRNLHSSAYPGLEAIQHWLGHGVRRRYDFENQCYLCWGWLAACNLPRWSAGPRMRSPHRVQGWSSHTAQLAAGAGQRIHLTITLIQDFIKTNGYTPLQTHFIVDPSTSSLPYLQNARNAACKALTAD